MKKLNINYIKLFEKVILLGIFGLCMYYMSTQANLVSYICAAWSGLMLLGK